jgi:hypothetical protein
MSQFQGLLAGKNVLTGMSGGSWADADSAARRTATRPNARAARIMTPV